MDATVESCDLLLAPRAVMATAAHNHCALDRRFADQARLAFTPVDAMLELKETFLAVGIHVIRNR